MSTAAEQMEAVVTAVAATVGIDPALIWPPGLHSLPVYVALWLGTMSILLFWYAFPKLPAQAEKQQAASKDFKLAALQNLLTAEKELEKEGAGSKDGADAQKLYDMLFDDVEQQPVTCLGIKADHPAFADTLALLKSRVNEELKQTVRKTRVALGSEAAEDGENAEDLEDYKEGGKLSECIEFSKNAAKHFKRVEPGLVDGAALAEAQALEKKIHTSRNELLKGIYAPLLPILPGYSLAILLSTGHSTLLGIMWAYKSQLDAQAAGKDPDSGAVMGMLWTYIIVEACMAPLGCLSEAMITQMSSRFELGLRSKVLKHLLSQDRVYYDRHDTSQLQTKLESDVKDVSENLLSLPQRLINAVVGVVTQGIIVWSICPDLAIRSMAISVPLSALVMKIVWGWNMSMHSRESRMREVSNSMSNELLQEIKTIKEFATEVEEKSRYVTNTMCATILTAKGRVVRKMAWNVDTYISLGVQAYNLYYCLQARVAGTMSGQDMIMLLKMLQDLSYDFHELMDLVPDLMKINEPLHRMAALLDSTPKIEAILDSDSQKLKPDRFRGEIVFKDVNFTYPTERQKQILFGLSFTALPGQKVAFVGKAGCGKSTSIGLIQAFYAPDSGSITLDGRPLLDYDLRHLRKHIGVVAQDNILFSKTIRENVCYGMPSDTPIEDVWEAVIKANAKEFVDGFPDKLETQVGAKGIKLSGGQKQRIAIARAMIRKPSILLLDEATSALDAVNEKEVQKSLDQMMKEHAGVCIVIAHRLSTIRNCDKIIIMDKGATVEEGTHDELLKRPIKRDADGAAVPGPGLYHEMWDTQIGEESQGHVKTRSQLEAHIEKLKKELGLQEKKLETTKKVSRAKTKLKSVVRLMRLGASSKMMDVEDVGGDAGQSKELAREASGASAMSAPGLLRKRSSMMSRGDSIYDN